MKKKRQCWPEAYRRRAIQLRLNENMSMRQIARRIGVPYSTTRAWLNSVEVPDEIRYRNCRRWSDADRSEVKLLYTAGWSMGQVSGFTGIPVTTISGWLRADPDVEVRDPRSYTDLAQKVSHDFIDRVRIMYEVEHMSTGEIAAIFGRHPTAIQKLCKRYGIPMRNRSERLKLRHRRQRETVLD